MLELLVSVTMPGSCTAGDGTQGFTHALACALSAELHAEPEICSLDGCSHQSRLMGEKMQNRKSGPCSGSHSGDRVSLSL